MPGLKGESPGAGFNVSFRRVRRCYESAQEITRIRSWSTNSSRKSSEERILKWLRT